MESERASERAHPEKRLLFRHSSRVGISGTGRRELLVFRTQQAESWSNIFNEEKIHVVAANPNSQKGKELFSPK